MPEKWEELKITELSKPDPGRNAWHGFSSMWKLDFFFLIIKMGMGTYGEKGDQREEGKGES